MDMSEEEILKKLSNKDPIIMEYIMDRHTKAVYSLTYKILQDVANKEDIEECVSDTFVKVWSDILKYDKGKGNIKTWILIIAKYKALDYRRKIYKREKLDYIEEDREIDSNTDTEKEVLSKEKIAELMKNIAELNRKDRSIFYKRYFLHNSVTTISNEEGLSSDAVYKRLSRIREKLTNKMKEVGLSDC